MSRPESHGSRADVADQLLLTLLLVDAVLLAVLEVFFVPLRLDGAVLPLAGWYPLPISLVVAAVSTPWLVSQTARVAVRMHAPVGLAALPLALWLATVLVLGLGGPGGDMVLIQDWRGIGLLAAGSIPGALMLGVRLGRQSTDNGVSRGSRGGADQRQASGGGAAPVRGGHRTGARRSARGRPAGAAGEDGGGRGTR
ncbi:MULTISPECIES: hypothetical protein [Thermocrispum]|jgi:hypothetical protein|uniref:Uncharacterized protein n=1 Tax=Thermocrispum agreste TaxID=37925 RepID=A0ABD6FFR3_9PSEU